MCATVALVTISALLMLALAVNASLYLFLLRRRARDARLVMWARGTDQVSHYVEVDVEFLQFTGACGRRVNRYQFTAIDYTKRILLHVSEHHNRKKRSISSTTSSGASPSASTPHTPTRTRGGTAYRRINSSPRVLHGLDPQPDDLPHRGSR